MCGICGIVRLTGISADEPIREMTRRLTPRGPDDEGYFADKHATLGHRRLSIIDLSDAGRQPMANEDATVHVLFNGEIYDYEPLRKELSAGGHVLSSRTDSEVILHLYEDHGERFVDRIDGMFAVAIWDATKRRLTLARDHMGKKPLYYARVRDGIAFASELKALLKHPEISRDIDQEALHGYLVLGYVPGEQSILKSVRKLSAGSTAVFDSSGMKINRYFDPAARPGDGGRLADVEGKTLALIKDAVRRRLVADVEVGVFLSGGIDSSLVAALVVESHPRVKTFSMGFSAGAFDESAHARRVAHVLGTEHIEETVDPRALIDAIPAVAAAFDEPFADASAIPTWLLARMTARHVKVALAGDGGDEIFGGYPTLRAQRVADALSFARPFQPALARAAGLLPEGSGYYPAGYVARRFAAGFAMEAWRRQVHWTSYIAPDDVTMLRPDLRGLPVSLAARAADCFTGDAEETSRNLDQRIYLPDDILVKSDRAAMANSLEVRAPLLDKRVVAAGNSLPRDLARGKIVLKRILARTRVPFAATRKKQGFAVPVSSWLRGELKDWARARLDELTPDGRSRDACSPSGCSDFGLESRGIDVLWNEHQSRARDRWRELWALVMLAEWRARWMKD